MNEAAQIILAIAIAGFGGGSLLMLVGAVARRIAGPKNGVSAREIKEMREDLEQMRIEHDDMRARIEQVDELQNRVDFAERVIAQARPKAVQPGAQ